MNPHALDVLEFEKVRRMLLRWTFSAWGAERVAALTPTLTIDDIQISQERISEWKELELTGDAPGAPAEMPDLRPLLMRLERGSGNLDGRQLFQFVPFLEHLAALRRIRTGGERQGETRPRLAEILRQVADFSSLRHRLERSVSPAGDLLDSASPELARIRRELLSAQQQASQLLEEMRGRVGEGREDSFVTLRDGRYVLSLRAQQRAVLPGLIHGRSQSGQSVLVEPYDAVQANNRVSEAREEEKLEEVRVLTELTDGLRDRAGELAAAFASVGILDLVRAGARLALELRGEPPALNQERRLRIVQGRHPILAAAESRGGAKVVPLDLDLGPTAPVLLISGPNMGGKSVALKTVGLLILMARAGLHVPAADGTDLPMIDDLFVDLGDEQSIEGDLSTFAGHLRNLADAWGGATDRSVVLMDELGGGTDPEEGGALAMAALEGMGERGALTVATTHLTSVKLFVSQREMMRNASMEFDAVSLTPRFRLKVGEPGRSRAFEIARRIVPDGAFLQRAESYRSPALLEMDRLFQQVDQERRELARERAHLEEARDRLARATLARERQASRLRERLDKLKSDRRAALGELYERAGDEVRKLREDLERRIEEAPQAAVAELRRAEREMSRRGAEARSRRPRRRGPPLSPDAIVQGAAVWVQGLEVVARLERVEGARAWVDLHGRRVEVPLSSLEEPPGEENSVPAPAPPRIRVPELPAAPLGREIDLRGCRVEEALEKLDRFLDQAALAHLHQVRIVHGKGTGALKRQVERYLKGHPLVHRFRMGELNEGGWGVTVADLEASEG